MMQRAAKTFVQEISTLTKFDFKLVIAAPPYDKQDTSGKGFWFQAGREKPDTRIRNLRKTLCADLNHILWLTSEYKPDLIMGAGQGAIVALLASFPLVLETACRLRVTDAASMRDYRRAWSRVRSIVGFNPSFQSITLDVAALQAAFPELSQLQPANMLKYLVSDDTFHERSSAVELGTLFRASTDKGRLPVKALRTSLLRNPPVYLDSDEEATVQGAVCVICGKQGPLGRCKNAER